MLKYDDCGLRDVWLSNGYEYVEVEGVGRCLEIADIAGLHKAIGHNLVNYKKRLGSADIRFLRVEMGLSQRRLADALGVDEQSVSLWERSQRRPTIAAERMIRLLYLEHADGETRIAELIKQWNDTDRQEDAERHVFEAQSGGWRIAA